MAASTQEPPHSRALRHKEHEIDDVVASFIREGFTEGEPFWTIDDVDPRPLSVVMDVGATNSEVLRAASSN